MTVRQFLSFNQITFEALVGPEANIALILLPFYVEVWRSSTLRLIYITV